MGTACSMYTKRNQPIHVESGIMVEIEVGYNVVNLVSKSRLMTP
jgi:hypothetical protein